MVQPTGPISILCGINASGEIVPVDIDTNRQIKVLSASLTMDASDVTYTPTTVADWDGGVDPGNQDDANDQLAERVKDLELIDLTKYIPVRYQRLWGANFVLAGNALAPVIVANQVLNTAWWQVAAANGDSLGWSCVLKAGSYTISLVGATSTNRGRIDIDFKHIDDPGWTNIVNQQDWYAGVTALNATKTATFTVTTSGRQIFRSVVDGKNAASSDYLVPISTCDIYLTAGDS